MRCGGDRRPRVAVLLLESRRDVAGHVVVHESLGGSRGVDPDHRRQELVVDPDPGDGVLGEVAVVGHDEGDGLADVVDLVGCERELGAAVRERRVRDQQRERLGHRSGQVVVGPDQVDALDVEHPGDVDVDDPGMGVGRPQHGRVQDVLAGGDVVGVPALAAQEALVLDPLDPLAEHPRGHGASSASSAARSTDLTMLV